MTRRSSAVAAVVCAIAVLAPYAAGWVQLERLPELVGLVVAAVLAASLDVQRRASSDGAIMPPAFIVVFASLMLLGPRAGLCVAAAAALTPGFVTRSAGHVQSLISAA